MSTNSGTTNPPVSQNPSIISLLGSQPANPATTSSLSYLHKQGCWDHYLVSSIDDQGQKLLAKLILMSDNLQYIDSHAEQTRLLQLILFACDSLTQCNNRIVAEEIQKEIEDIIKIRMERRKKWDYGLRRFFSSPRSRRVYTALGLFVFLVSAVVLAISYDASKAADLFSIPVQYFTAAILFGTLGSSLSIMLRFNESKVKASDIPMIDLFLVGLFKPIIGAVFALVMFAAYKAGLLSMFQASNEGTAIYLLIIIFFLAGFSERWVGDIISKIERAEG